MANKTIYPYGVGGQTPSGIEIVDYTTGGNDKAASAESVKELAQYVFVGSGSFADAYDASRGSTINFPWLLEDTDEEGNTLKKMIWHVGNGKFIDAIGAEIVGKKNGLTIKSDEARTITLSFSGGSVTLPIAVGETNYGFNEIKELANVSGYNGDWFSGISFSGDTQPQLDIDFGGMTLKWSSSSGNRFPAYSAGSVDTLSDYLFKYIKRLRLDVSGYLIMYPMLSLKEVEMYGTWSYKDFLMLSSKSHKTFITEKADLKGLIVTNAVTSISLLNSDQSNYSLQYLDIRGFDTSNVTSLRIAWKCYALNTLIIGGGFSNEKVTSLGSGPRLVAANTTIVCTSQTPPVLKNAVLNNDTYVHSDMDWVYYRVKSNGRILVPPGCADVYKNNVYIEPVDGEDITITTDGKTTKTGWAMYADIIEEYNEGDY